VKKAILLAILTATLALCQSVSITAGAGEPTVTATFSGPAITQLASQIQSAPASTLWPNTVASVPQSTTLTASMTAVQTTISLASSTGVAICNGLLIDSEVMVVVNTSPLTLQRGMISTAAATHANNAPVTVLRVGAYNCQLKAMWFDQMATVITSKLNATALSQSQAALTAQQTANAAVAAAGVQ
jgi:hypothetical protein